MHVLLLVVSMIYGANFSIAKTVMPDWLSPGAFIIWRMGGACLLFSLYHRAFVRERIRGLRDWLHIAAAGLFGMCLNMLLFFEGLNLTSTVNASLLITTTPIVVSVLSWGFLRERPAWWQALGVAMGFVGAAIIIVQSRGGVAPGHWQGDLLIAANATSYAVYLVMVRPLMKRYHPVTIVRGAFAFALLFSLPFTWQDVLVAPYERFPAPTWGAIGYVVVATTFLVFLFNALALRKLPASVVGAYIYLQPVFATLIASWWLAYPLSWSIVFCAVLIFAGVYLTGRRRSAPSGGSAPQPKKPVKPKAAPAPTYSASK